jgi:hypothetical protein
MPGPLLCFAIRPVESLAAILNTPAGGGRDDSETGQITRAKASDASAGPVVFLKSHAVLEIIQEPCAARWESGSASSGILLLSLPWLCGVTDRRSSCSKIISDHFTLHHSLKQFDHFGFRQLRKMCVGGDGERAKAIACAT